MLTPVEVTRTYLELSAPHQLRPVPSPDPTLRLEHAADCAPALYRRLYRDVGERYHWRDRAEWSDDQIRTHLARAEISVWVLYRGQAPAGWFELARHDDASVEIAYFGLLPEFTGAGLGKHMLSLAAEEAWRLTHTRVWLHTCTLDSPAALPNYLARGFRPFRQERYTVSVERGDAGA
ncbi:MAG TPA: GNAT family N-acetyltransferase [Gemmatimonadaceae bacterium]|nr:GNAT family N-acetyltransferase [Gemmatimonadaceae bacterium]